VKEMRASAAGRYEFALPQRSGSFLQRFLVAFDCGWNTGNMQKGEIGKGGERYGRLQPRV